MNLLTPETEPHAAVSAAAVAPRPYFTYGLIALLFVVFGIEVVLNVGALGELLAPSLSTLYLLGGADRDLVVGGAEWWRLLTGPLLHADLSHVGFNCLALFLVRRVEPVAGWRWTAATFAVSAVCGAVMSIMLNPANVISIGASGGIVGVFVLAIYVGTRMPAGRPRQRLLTQATYGAVSAILPFLHGGGSSGGTQVDYAAHFGGAIGGALVVGVLAFRLWPRDTAQPRGQRVALGIAVVYFAAAALSAIPIVLLGSQLSLLDPSLPGKDDLVAQSAELIKQYPHDPRIIMARGIAAERQHDFAGTETDLRAALAENKKLRGLLPPALEQALDGMLGSVLVEEGRLAEAKAVAAPACDLTDADFAASLRTLGLCPGAPAVAPKAMPAASSASSAAPVHLDPTVGVVVQQPERPIEPVAALDDALTKLRKGDVAPAQKELLAAYNALKIAPSSVDPVVARNVQALLAIADYTEGYNGLANDLAKPICSFETSGIYATMLQQDGLCL